MPIFTNSPTTVAERSAESNSRSKSNQVVLSTSLVSSSTKSIKRVSTPNFGMLSSMPFGNLHLNRSPSAAHMEFTVVETAVSAVFGRLPAPFGDDAAQGLPQDLIVIDNQHAPDRAIRFHGCLMVSENAKRRAPRLFEGCGAWDKSSA